MTNKDLDRLLELEGMLCKGNFKRKKEYQSLKSKLEEQLKKSEKWDKLHPQTEGFMKAFNFLQNECIEKLPGNLTKIEKLEQENKHGS